MASVQSTRLCTLAYNGGLGAEGGGKASPEAESLLALLRPMGGLKFGLFSVMCKLLMKPKKYDYNKTDSYSTSIQGGPKNGATVQCTCPK